MLHPSGFISETNTAELGQYVAIRANRRRVIIATAFVAWLMKIFEQRGGIYFRNVKYVLI